jgi:DNA topoisomerase-1
MGRFGPFVQIGTKDDEEKPKFAGLRAGQKMDTIDLATGLDLFQLPRKLGLTADGEEMVANVGRFGPYVKFGAKYVSIKDEDPYTITTEKALELIKAKLELDANRLIKDFPDDGIQLLNGRFGPYITNKEKNAKIPKDRDPKSLTIEECRALLEAAPARGTGRFGRRFGTQGKTGKGKSAPVKKANGKAPKAAGGKAAAMTESGAVVGVAAPAAKPARAPKKAAAAKPVAARVAAAGANGAAAPKAAAPRVSAPQAAAAKSAAPAAKAAPKKKPAATKVPAAAAKKKSSAAA